MSHRLNSRPPKIYPLPPDMLPLPGVFLPKLKRKSAASIFPADVLTLHQCFEVSA